MIDISNRAAELQQEEKKNPKDWKERLANDIKTQDGWKEFLDVMAEHPNYSVYNDARITHYRIINDVHDTQELITYDGAKKLGGYVMKGAKGIFLATPTEDGKFRGVAHFPASVCRKLPVDRYRHRPLKADTDDVESMQMFMQAEKDVNAVINLDEVFNTPELKDISSWVIGQRYNLLSDKDTIPAIPDVSDLKALIDNLKSAQQKIEDVCKVVDQSLKYQRHPEWKEEDELKEKQKESPQKDHVYSEKTQQTENEVAEEERKAALNDYYDSDDYKSEVQSAHEYAQYDSMEEYINEHKAELSDYIVKHDDLPDDFPKPSFMSDGEAFDKAAKGSDLIDWEGAPTVPSDNASPERKEWYRTQMRDFIEEHHRLPENYPIPPTMNPEQALEYARVALGLTTAQAVTPTTPSAADVRRSVHQAHEKASQQQSAQSQVESMNKSRDMGGLGY